MTDTPDERDALRLLPRLRFRDLQVIAGLARERSLRATAAQFAVTQSALSRNLAEIEKAFGVPLFVRSARGVLPTPHGEVAVRGAAMLLQELMHLRTETAQGERGHLLLRLGSPPFLAHGFLPQVIAHLSRRTPPVRIELTESGVPAIVDGLLAGTLDALVSPLQGLADQRWERSVRFEPLFEASYAVIAHRTHPLAGVRRVGWQRLAQEPWIFPLPGTAMHRMLEDRFARAGTPLPMPVVQMTGPTTAISLAASGVGIAVVPRLSLQMLQRVNEVRELDAHPRPEGSQVGLVTRAGAQNPRVSVLREALAAGGARRRPRSSLASPADL